MMGFSVCNQLNQFHCYQILMNTGSWFPLMPPPLALERRCSSECLHPGQIHSICAAFWLEHSHKKPLISKTKRRGQGEMKLFPFSFFLFLCAGRLSQPAQQAGYLGAIQLFFWCCPVWSFFIILSIRQMVILILVRYVMKTCKNFIFP